MARSCPVRRRSAKLSTHTLRILGANMASSRKSSSIRLIVLRFCVAAPSPSQHEVVINGPSTVLSSSAMLHTSFLPLVARA